MELFRKPKTSDQYYSWNRGENIRLSNNFQAYEFDCHCDYSDCKEQRIQRKLIDKLQDLRAAVDAPLRINSAFRCRRHQAKLRKSGIKTAKGKSTHELGNAIDVALARQGGSDFDRRFRRFKKEAAEYFKAIGLASRWLHLDTRDDKVRRWHY